MVHSFAMGAGKVDLGVVRAGVLERAVSFEAPCAVIEGAIELPGPRGPIALRVSPSGETLKLEVSPLPPFRDVTMEAEIPIAGSTEKRALVVRIVRTVPISTLALALVPLLFFLRHVVSAFGNVPTAIAATIPVVGSFALEKLAPVGSWRVRALPVAAMCAALPLIAYVALRAWRPFEAVVSHDDVRDVAGARQPPGTIGFFRKSSKLDDQKRTGCAWTNGKPEHCYSTKPFEAPADGLLDGIDAWFGSTVTRLRCQSDGATVDAVTSSPNEELPCSPTADVPLLGSPRIARCALAVREASGGTCGPVATPLNAWVKFPGFLATARLRPSGGAKARLECDAAANGCVARDGTDGFTVVWDGAFAVEIADLCTEASDSVCAVRSVEANRVAGVPLPMKMPFRITAVSPTGARAQSVCTLADGAPKELRIEVLEDAKWMKTVSLSDAKGAPLLQCSPIGDVPSFALVVIDRSKEYKTEVNASDDPSAQTIIPIASAIDVHWRGSQREWSATVQAVGPHYARFSRLDCPKMGNSLSLTSTQRTVSSTTALGSVDSLFVISKERASSPISFGVLDKAQHCTQFPKSFDTLPVVLRCASGPSPDHYGAYTGEKQALPWCVESSQPPG